MGAGFEREVGDGALGVVSGGAQCVDFGVCFAGLLMLAFANNGSVVDEDAANHRVRVRRVRTARCQLQRTRHMRAVSGGKHDQVFFLPSNSGSSDICSRLAAVSEIRWSRLISSSNSVMSWNRRYTEAKRT